MTIQEEYEGKIYMPMHKFIDMTGLAETRVRSFVEAGIIISMPRSVKTRGVYIRWKESLGRLEELESCPSKNKS